MALTKFANCLNSARLRDPSARRLFRKYAEQIISIVDDAMSEGSQVLDEQAFQAYRDELDGILDVLQPQYDNP